MQALGTPEKQIAVLPVFATWLQASHGGQLGSSAALSIVQARFVGLAHFSVGYVLTYGPFVISAVSTTLSKPAPRISGEYLHFQLALALAALGTASSLTANHLDAFMVYAFLGNDLVAISALYTHHQYIAGFFLCGAFAHGAIFLIRDATLTQWVQWLIGMRAFVLSHLSAITLFLGFHTLGLYVHNDVMQALGTPEKQIAGSRLHTVGNWALRSRAATSSCIMPLLWVFTLRRLSS